MDSRDANASVTGWRAGSGRSDATATSANRVRAEAESDPVPLSGSLRKMSEGSLPRGSGRGGGVRGAVSQQNPGGFRRGKVAAAAQRAAQGNGGRAGRPASPLPASGPSHSHAGPRPLGLLPPRGHQPPGEEDGPTTSCFRQRDPEVIPAPPPARPRTQRKKLFEPQVPKQIRRGCGARGNSRGI